MANMQDCYSDNHFVDIYLWPLFNSYLDHKTYKYYKSYVPSRNSFMKKLSVNIIKTTLENGQMTLIFLLSRLHTHTLYHTWYTYPYTMNDMKIHRCPRRGKVRICVVNTTAHHPNAPLLRTKHLLAAAACWKCCLLTAHKMRPSPHTSFPRITTLLDSSL